MAKNPRSIPPAPTTVPHRGPASAPPATEPASAPESESDSADLRIKLIKRLGLAGGVILLLLLGLNWLDQGGSGDEAEPRFTRPVPVANKNRQEAIKPVVPAPPDLQPPPGMAGDLPPATSAVPPAVPPVASSAVQSPPAAPAAPAVPETPVSPAPATPAATPTPVAPAPASRQHAESPSRSAPARPAGVLSTEPAPSRIFGTPPSQPASQAQQPANPPPLARGTLADAGKTAVVVRKPPQEPLTAPPEEKLPSDTALIRLPPMLPRQASGFVLQAGVFNSTSRAEEIYATLQKHGVPATLEARVQVGPFRSKAEAEQARSKLQALGIEIQVLAPSRNR